MSLPKLGFSRVDVPLPAQNPADLAAEIERLQEEAVIARSVETSLTVEVERLRENAEARERFLKREGDLLRAVERERDDLRREVADLQMQRDERMIDNQHAYDEGFRNGESDGRTDERAAVVAWLRALPEMDFEESLWRIERGEHRREEAR